MKRWIKRIVTTVFGLGLVGAVVYAFLPKPVPVDVARVGRGNLQVCVEEDGKTRLRDRYVAQLEKARKLHAAVNPDNKAIIAKQASGAVEAAEAGSNN